MPTKTKKTKAKKTVKRKTTASKAKKTSKRKASASLMSIIKIAKRIYKDSPSKKWTSCVSQASKEFRRTK